MDSTPALGSGNTDHVPITPEGKRAVWAGAIGSLLEMYDFALFGAATALVFSPLFFTSVSPSAAILASFATFAVGILARPIGAVAISHFGDKVGRKPALIATILLMGVATSMIGLLPTYSQVGIWAPVLLVVCRLLQGIGAGAEFSGSITFIVEHAPRRQRTYYSSFGAAAFAMGIALATLTFLAVSWMPEDAFLSYGWRIPFLFGAVIFVVAYLIRKNLTETPAFVAAEEKADEERKHKLPIVELFRERGGNVFYGTVALTSIHATSYILSTYALTYIAKTLGMPSWVGLTATTIATVLAAILIPQFGKLGDIYGAHRVMAAGALFGAAAVIPYFLLLDTRQPALIIAATALAYSIGYSAMVAGHGAFLARLFDTRTRYTGISVTRELNSSIIGSTAPLIAAFLVQINNGSPWWLATYLIAAGVVSLIAIVMATRQSRSAMFDDDMSNIRSSTPAATGPTSPENMTVA
ncbi:MFS transporter [Rhodococcus opacus]|uniref:MFS transporter n=1 Tax=Rhodococcus opacus TaxID=37919 RepID=UPI001C445598|nr:MFS transporter [Rhodococcus opacus]MBV6760428.1 MHS family MFS transporter [Rhodococcus opacus]